MNWQLFLPLLATSVVTMSGWYILHFLARKRDIENKKKELRINYLIEAWRRLERCVNRKNTDPTHDIENSIADIQLFGTPKQIELAGRVISNLVKDKNANLDELLEELRQDLRKELFLEKIETKIQIFRLKG
ncbi:MAG: hypothetical protein HYZ15_03305 [Sphingobacteriales bacterium]|nr:hypothetical protein [Sphingobacteriales bacterium]